MPVVDAAKPTFRCLHQSLGGLVGGVVADRLIKDPAHWHPVALFGNYASYLETRLYRDSKLAGAKYLIACVVPPTVIAGLLARRMPQLSLGLALWAALGGSTLERIGTELAAALEAEDLAAARQLIPWLCSRDPARLGAADMARAGTESLAENTSDAAIAPLFWALAGAPGVVLHRCVNTLDAMVGYPSTRYQNFGWAAAKFDDLLAWPAARLTALLHVAQAAASGRGAAARHAWRNDAPQHPSPNAGPVEATAAAALGVQLGGATTYAHGVEQRPRLGRGPAPTAKTLRQAVRLSRRTQLLAALAVALLRWARRC